MRSPYKPAAPGRNSELPLLVNSEIEMYTFLKLNYNVPTYNPSSPQPSAPEPAKPPSSKKNRKTIDSKSVLKKKK